MTHSEIPTPIWEEPLTEMQLHHTAEYVKDGLGDGEEETHISYFKLSGDKLLSKLNVDVNNVFRKLLCQEKYK